MSENGAAEEVDARAEVDADFEVHSLAGVVVVRISVPGREPLRFSVSPEGARQMGRVFIEAAEVAEAPLNHSTGTTGPAR
jgi:hypothetical protein